MLKFGGEPVSKFVLFLSVSYSSSSLSLFVAIAVKLINTQNGQIRHSMLQCNNQHNRREPQRRYYRSISNHQQGISNTIGSTEAKEVQRSELPTRIVERYAKLYHRRPRERCNGTGTKEHCEHRYRAVPTHTVAAQRKRSRIPIEE